MNITAIYNGEEVTIVNVDVNGCEIYLTYTTSADQLKVSRAFFDHKSDYTIIATSATVVS